MTPRRIWRWGILALLAVWVCAAAGIWLARTQRMTADKAVAWLEGHSLAGASPTARRQIIDGMADRVNRLTFEERQKFRYEGRLREWFESMTPEERAYYIERTLPQGMEQLMKAFNDMPQARRKQLVNRALNDLARVRDEIGQRETDAVFNDANMQRWWMKACGVSSGTPTPRPSSTCNR